VRNAHCDGIAAEQTLVEDLDIGAFHEAQFKQTALEFGGRQACGDTASGNGEDAASEAHTRVA
jgi:hypothetical protein